MMIQRVRCWGSQGLQGFEGGAGELTFNQFSFRHELIKTNLEAMPKNYLLFVCPRRIIVAILKKATKMKNRINIFIDTTKLVLFSTVFCFYKLKNRNYCRTPPKIKARENK